MCRTRGYVDTHRTHLGYVSDTPHGVSYNRSTTSDTTRTRLVHDSDMALLFCSVIEPPSRTTGLLTKFRRKKIDNTILTIMTPNNSVFFFCGAFSTTKQAEKEK